MLKLLSLDDLYNFFSQQGQTCRYSSENNEDGIIVQIEEELYFDKQAEEQYNPDEGLLKTHLQSCHLYKNRNNSSISEEAMLEAIPSFYNRPILGYIHQLSDGSYDFAGHELIEDKNGNIEYKEIPVGVIPESCNAQLIYDKEKEKTYLEVDGYIYEEYTKAADILREKGKCKVSIEISVDEMSYSATEKVLNIEKFHFRGVTILGKRDDSTERPIEEGMEGSNITLANFSKRDNSLFTNSNNGEIVKMLEDINAKIACLTNFTINTKSLEEGGNHMTEFLKELLLKYDKSIEELEFDYESMSEDELVSAFAEAFDVESGETSETEPESEGTEVVEHADNNTEDVEATETNTEAEIETEDGTETEVEHIEETVTVEASCDTVLPVTYSVSFNNDSVRSFEVSLDEIQQALYNLVNTVYGTEDDWYSVRVYETYIVMDNWRSNQTFKQSYERENDNFILVGDRVEVFKHYLTAEEEEALAKLREKYAEATEKLASYEKAEADAKKDAILANSAYASYTNSEAFKNLKENRDSYSVEEFDREAKLAYANCKLAFEAEQTLTNTVSVRSFTFNVSNSHEDSQKKNPYGTLSFKK